MSGQNEQILSYARAVQAAADPSAPITEQGVPDNNVGQVRAFGTPGWSQFTGDPLEWVPELQWPTSIRTYHMMRNDAQIQGLFLGSTLPIRRYNFYLSPNGAKEEVLTQLSSDYNIPIHGHEEDPRPRMARKFSFRNHIRHSLLALLYGHMYFEQVGDILDDDLWHLRKLAPRMPSSIREIKRANDGGLVSILQYGGGFRSLKTLSPQREIKVNRLLAYIWEQEGMDWIGRSMLRGIYKNWLLKDTVLRVGAINIERAGGVPVVVGPKGATPDDLAELSKMARQFRIGEGSGGAIPNGAELTLASAAGGEEAVAYVKLMNEEMGRGWLMMFMNLGQAQTGSYALGSSLLDFVMMAQETIADWFVDTFNEHEIEDHVTWNWGLKEQAPILGYTRNDDRQLPIADLAALIDKRVIQVDDELEAWIREEYRMPKPGTPRAVPEPPPQTTSPVQARRQDGGRRSGQGSPPPASSAEPPDVHVELSGLGLDRETLNQAITERVRQLTKESALA